MIMRGLRAFLLLTGLWHSSCRLVWVEVIRPAGAGFVLARWLAGDGRDSFNTPAAPSWIPAFACLQQAGRAATGVLGGLFRPICTPRSLQADYSVTVKIRLRTYIRLCVGESLSPGLNENRAPVALSCLRAFKPRRVSQRFRGRSNLLLHIFIATYGGYVLLLSQTGRYSAP